MGVGCGALKCIFHMEVGCEALKHELPHNFTALEGEILERVHTGGGRPGNKVKRWWFE